MCVCVSTWCENWPLKAPTVPVACLLMQQVPMTTMSKLSRILCTKWLTCDLSSGMWKKLCGMFSQNNSQPTSCLAVSI